MFSNNPLITIGITSYNSSDTLASAIESAINQDWPNTEIIIVDDASSDSGPQIVEAYIQKNHRIRLVKLRRNMGVAHARNVIVNEAKGEFVAFFDDDDVSVPHRLSSQFRRIKAYEKKFKTQLTICHSARLQLFPDGYRRYENTMGTNSHGQAPNGLAVVNRILIGKLSPNVIGSCATCSQMAYTKIYKQLSGFDATLRRGEDTDFNIRLALAGGHFLGIAEPLVIQTMTHGCDKKLRTEYRMQRSIINKYKDYLAGWHGFSKRWLFAKFRYMEGKKLQSALIIMPLLFSSPLKVLRKFLWSWPERGLRNDLKKWYKTQSDKAKNL